MPRRSRWPTCQQQKLSSYIAVRKGCPGCQSQTIVISIFYKEKKEGRKVHRFSGGWDMLRAASLGKARDTHICQTVFTMASTPCRWLDLPRQICPEVRSPNLNSIAVFQPRRGNTKPGANYAVFFILPFIISTGTSGIIFLSRSQL